MNELDQAISALDSAAAVLAKIATLAEMAKEHNRPAVTLYLDGPTIPDVQQALSNAQMVLALHAKRTDLVQQCKDVLLSGLGVKK